VAYFETIQLVSGDTKPDLNFTVRDSTTAATGQVLDKEDPTTWGPLDLTGKTVRFKFRPLGGVLENPSVNVIICDTIPPYINGDCVMNWNEATLDVDAGTYEAEIEVEDSNGGIYTVFDKLKFKIRADF